MTSFKFFTFFYIFFCFILEIQAQVLTIPKNAEELNLDSYFSIFNDSSEKYTVQQVISKPFLFTEKANKNFTVSKAKSFWIKVSILNQSNCLEWIANFDHKEVILYDSLGNQLAKTGHGFPFSERFFGHTFGHRIFLPISLPSNIQKTFFIQVKTSDIFILSPENMLVPVLKSYAKIAETYRWFTVGNIATIAILFALGIYHFIIYILTKDKNYFYFSLFSCF
ncbi:MAG: hypothetical protein EAZ97_04025 [Bacteroidetes bacterium]|nr:MAG: hypothetical protein EAZ97_04025 [Bacteroidota bacterium]